MADHITPAMGMLRHGAASWSVSVSSAHCEVELIGIRTRCTTTSADILTAHTMDILATWALFEAL